MNKQILSNLFLVFLLTTMTISNQTINENCFTNLTKKINIEHINSFDSVKQTISSADYNNVNELISLRLEGPLFDEKNEKELANINRELGTNRRLKVTYKLHLDNASKENLEIYFRLYRKKLMIKEEVQPLEAYFDFPIKDYVLKEGGSLTYTQSTLLFLPDYYDESLKEFIIDNYSDFYGYFQINGKSYYYDFANSE